MSSRNSPKSTDGNNSGESSSTSKEPIGTSGIIGAKGIVAGGVIDSGWDGGAKRGFK
jgi:hypothetical protein